MDDEEYISILAEDLFHEHPDKYRFTLEKPEFVSWFIGRIVFNNEFKFDFNTVESVVKELIKKKP